MNTFTRRVLHPPREVPAHTRALVEALGERAREVHAYVFDGCRCIVALERIDGREQLHLSVQRDDRWPDMLELMHARLALLPAAKTFGLIMPSVVDLETARHYQLHVHELPDRQSSW